MKTKNNFICLLRPKRKNGKTKKNVFLDVWNLRSKYMYKLEIHPVYVQIPHFITFILNDQKSLHYVITKSKISRLLYSSPIQSLFMTPNRFRRTYSLRLDHKSLFERSHTHIYRSTKKFNFHVGTSRKYEFEKFSRERLTVQRSASKNPSRMRGEDANSWPEI